MSSGPCQEVRKDRPENGLEPANPPSPSHLVPDMRVP